MPFRKAGCRSTEIHILLGPFSLHCYTRADFFRDVGGAVNPKQRDLGCDICVPQMIEHKYSIAVPTAGTPVIILIHRADCRL